jgi:hypothetical protein
MQDPVLGRIVRILLDRESACREVTREVTLR